MENMVLVGGIVINISMALAGMVVAMARMGMIIRTNTVVVMVDMDMTINTSMEANVSMHMHTLTQSFKILLQMFPLKWECLYGIRFWAEIFSYNAFYNFL